MKSTKPKGHFVSQGLLKESESPARFSHAVSKTRKRLPPGVDRAKLPPDSKYNARWFVKPTKSDEVAYREVVAQEFFRLLIPWQPKTRLVMEKFLYIASKEVPGFRSINSNPRRFNAGVKDGTYKGLGDVLVLSLLMNEIDLKGGNIGYDAKGRVIKIDGDWCFARLDPGFENVDYKITAEGIKQLPFPDKYPAHNWLDSICDGVAEPPTDLVDAKTSISPRFRAEVNGAILKALILPTMLLKKFINTYVPDEKYADVLLWEMIQRKRQLEVAAFANVEFVKYLRTDLAKKHLNSYLKTLSEFKTTKKNFLVTSFDEIQENIAIKFPSLSSAVKLPDMKHIPAEVKVSSRPLPVKPGIDISIPKSPMKRPPLTIPTVDLKNSQRPRKMSAVTQSGIDIKFSQDSKSSAADAKASRELKGKRVRTYSAVHLTVPQGAENKRAASLPHIEVKKHNSPTQVLSYQPSGSQSKPQPSKKGFWSNLTKRGALFGLGVGLLAAGAFIALRVLDVITFGLSLPVTIPLTIVGGSLVGTLAGVGIGKAVEHHQSSPSLKIDVKEEKAVEAKVEVKLDSRLTASIDYRVKQLDTLTQKQMPIPNNWNLPDQPVPVKKRSSTLVTNQQLPSGPKI